MNPKTIATLYKKELLEVLRDKKSVIITLLLPLILYPVLFLAMGLILSMVESHEEGKEYTVAIPEGYEITDELWRSLSAIDEQLVFVEADDAAEALEAGEIRAYLAAEEKDDLYAFAAIWALSRIYTSESVLFGEGGFNIRLFELRKNIKKGNLLRVCIP